MTVFTFVIVIVVLSAVVAPLAKGLARRLSKGGPVGADLQRVLSELEQADQRLADTERRLQLAEERLDFQEKLLGSRAGADVATRIAADTTSVAENRYPAGPPARPAEL
ncbi:hypothetical protein BH23GEM9_BH23GEM9_21860 [soil metagenome]